MARKYVSLCMPSVTLSITMMKKKIACTIIQKSIRKQLAIRYVKSLPKQTTLTKKINSLFIKDDSKEVVIGAQREVAAINLIRCAHPAEKVTSVRQHQQLDLPLQVSVPQLRDVNKMTRMKWEKMLQGTEVRNFSCVLRAANAEKNEKRLLENRLKMSAVKELTSFQKSQVLRNIKADLVSVQQRYVTSPSPQFDDRVRSSLMREEPVFVPSGMPLPKSPEKRRPNSSNMEKVESEQKPRNNEALVARTTSPAEHM